jgi:hypothetical protein
MTAAFLRPGDLYREEARVRGGARSMKHVSGQKRQSVREGGAQAVRTVAAVSSSKSGRAEAYIGAERMRRRTHASKPFSRIQAGRTSL